MAYAMLEGPDGRPVVAKGTFDGKLLVDGDGTSTAAKVKPLEAVALAGNTLLSDLTWVGGTISAPTSVFVQATSSNLEPLSVGVVGGSSGISLAAGESVTIDFPDPTQWEIRVSGTDSASLVATEPV